MGWGMTVKDVYVSRVTRKDIDNRLEDAKDEVNLHRDYLRALAMSTPRPQTMPGGEQIDWIEWAGQEFDQTMQSLEDAIWMKHILTIAKENIELDGPDAIISDFDEEDEDGDTHNS
jgi:hypothetical protein